MFACPIILLAFMRHDIIQHSVTTGFTTVPQPGDHPRPVATGRSNSTA